MRISIIVAALLGAVLSAGAEIKTEELEYSSEGTALHGYLAYDDAVEGKRPGVLVVHEWWGMNEHPRKQARRLAKEGYVALALDMYGAGKSTTHPSEAGAFAAILKKEPEKARARFMAALTLLRKQAAVDPERVAAIGYCFGGGVVLEMARSGADLDAVVSFHGSLKPVDPEAPRKIKAKILVCNGAEDGFVPAEDITAFHEEMKAAKADYQFLSLEGAKHSFTNPDADKVGIDGLAYSAAADKTSWKAMLELFKDAIGP